MPACRRPIPSTTRLALTNGGTGEPRSRSTSKRWSDTIAAERPSARRNAENEPRCARRCGAGVQLRPPITAAYNRAGRWAQRGAGFPTCPPTQRVKRRTERWSCEVRHNRRPTGDSRSYVRLSRLTAGEKSLTCRVVVRRAHPVAGRRPFHSDSVAVWRRSRCVVPNSRQTCDDRLTR